MTHFRPYPMPQDPTTNFSEITNTFLKDHAKFFLFQNLFCIIVVGFFFFFFGFSYYYIYKKTKKRERERGKGNK